MTHTTYPLSLGDITPGEGFTRMAMPLTPKGYPEGIHTGGPFLSPDGLTVWKPLDCRPYQNCECRVPTNEAVVLELMSGQPCFPRHWQTITQNGRQWLIRPRVKVYGQDLPIEALDRTQILTIEQAVRTLNESHWQVSDDLVIAQDTDGQPFILDLSNAQFMGTGTAWPADDTDRVIELMERAEHYELVTHRKLGRSVYHAAPSGSRSRHPHVYLATTPLTDLEVVELGRITSVVRGQRRAAAGSDSFTRQAATMPFIQTQERLSEAVEQRYGLTWAYSPLQYQPKPIPFDRE